MKTFNPIKYLEDQNIKFWTSGKNVGRGWINIKCPFCEDNTNHLGINLRSGAFSCWKCGTTGSPTKLISTLERIAFTEAKQKAILYGATTIKVAEKEIEEFKMGREVHTLFPPYPETIKNYLIKRGFPEDFKPVTPIYYSYHFGKFKFRITVPITLNNQIIGICGRDITNKASVKYMTDGNNKHSLYGLDACYQGGEIILVEGMFDQWKIGSPSCAVMGSSCSKEQILALYHKHPSKVIILFDPETKAQKNALKLAGQIWFAECEVVELIDNKDPGDWTMNEAETMKNDLLEKPWLNSEGRQLTNTSKKKYL